MRQQENQTQEQTTSDSSNILKLKDGREYQISIEQQFMQIFDTLPKHLDLNDLNREVTNIILGAYPALNEFLKSYPPAQAVGDANEFLNTSQVFNICNDIIFNEELNESIVYNFLKVNRYQLANVGNDKMCWIIKTIK